MPALVLVLVLVFECDVLVFSSEQQLCTCVSFSASFSPKLP